MTKTSKTGLDRRAFIGGATLAVGAVAMPAVLRAQAVKWIGASATAPTDFIAISLDMFGKRVGEITKGEISLTTHHAGSLGGEREHVEGLLQGAVHVASPGAAILGGWYKPAEVWTYPFMFSNVAHKDKVMTALMKEYGDDCAAASKLRPVASIPRMPRQLTSNRVVKTPADMKGFKVRVPETQMWLKTFQRFGASPTPMAFPEVFAALKSGVIDGQENPAALSFNSGMFDVNKNLALTEHMMQDNMIVMAEAVYGKLSEAHRKAVDQAARDMEDDLRKRVVEDDKAIFEKIKAKGTAINEVDKDAFRAAIKGMDAEFPHVKKWVDRIAQIK